MATRADHDAKRNLHYSFSYLFLLQEKEKRDPDQRPIYEGRRLSHGDYFSLFFARLIDHGNIQMEVVGVRCSNKMNKICNMSFSNLFFSKSA